MIRQAFHCAALTLATLALGAPSAPASAQQGGGPSGPGGAGGGAEFAMSPDQVVDAIERARSQVKALLKEYQATGDELVLRCLRSKLKRLQVLEATVLGIAGGGEGEAPAPAEPDPRCRQFPAFCEPTPPAAGNGKDANKVLAATAQQAQQLAEDARACLRVDSGEIVDYLAANDPQGPPDQLPDLPTIDDNLAVEPEPVDRPLSGVELP